jgi:hypothetical protein
VLPSQQGFQGLYYRKHGTVNGFNPQRVKNPLWIWVSRRRTCIKKLLIIWMEFSKKIFSKKIINNVKKSAKATQKGLSGFVPRLIHIMLIFEPLKITEQKILS